MLIQIGVDRLAQLAEGLEDGAGHRHFLLGYPDEENALLGVEMAESVLEDIVLALALSEADQFEVLVVDEITDGAEEGLGDGGGRVGGGEAVAEVLAEEGGDPASLETPSAIPPRTRPSRRTETKRRLPPRS